SKSRLHGALRGPEAGRHPQAEESEEESEDSGSHGQHGAGGEPVPSNSGGGKTTPGQNQRKRRGESDTPRSRGQGSANYPRIGRHDAGGIASGGEHQEDRGQSAQTNRQSEGAGKEGHQVADPVNAAGGRAILVQNQRTR